MVKRFAQKSISTISLLIVFLVWLALSTSGVVPGIFLPSPIKVISALSDLRSTIVIHTAATALRTITGFALGTTLGFLLGIAMDSNRIIHLILDQIIESIRPVPPVAVLPFFILWFGVGNLGQIILITMSCAVIITVDTYVAIRNVNPIYIRAAMSLGANKRNIYSTIIIPAILPHLTAGLRIAASIAFTITIAAEFMGAQHGLGTVIMRSRRTLETHTIFLCVLIIGILSMLLDRSIRWILSYKTKWASKSDEAVTQETAR